MFGILSAWLPKHGEKGLTVPFSFPPCTEPTQGGVGHFQLKKVVPDSDGTIRNCIASVGNPFHDGSKERVSTLPSALRPI